MLFTHSKFALLSLSLLAGSSNALTSYANDWVDPGYIAARPWNASVEGAQETVIAWAERSAANGPWSVLDKPATPPTGDKRDFMSWAPYWWPDCSEAGNSTELSNEEIYSECTYVRRDGEFNPDYRDLTDSYSFQSMSDAILYNVLAFVISDDAKYADNAVNFIDTWFLSPESGMKPNLDYAQMIRGVGRSAGTRTGVLDLKGMTKIASAVMVLREVNAPQWTEDRNNGLNDWSRQYIGWLQNAELALEERAAENNHGTYYFNQLAAIQLMVGDFEGAKGSVMDYLHGIYQRQIDADGEQPLEAARTRPYHYRAYNLAGMITNIRILAQADPSVLPDIWHFETESGGTIQKALEFAMAGGVPEDEENYAKELYPSVGAFASALGDDGSGKYAEFLAEVQPDYPNEAWFLWNQPMWDSGYDGEGSSGSGGDDDSSEGNQGGSGATPDQEDGDESAAGQTAASILMMACGVVVSHVAVSTLL